MLDKTIDGKYTLIGLKEKGEAFQSHLAHYHLLGTQVMVDLIYPGRLPGGAAPLTSRLDPLLTLRHPAICRVFAWGEEEDYVFVVREFTHGTLLPELLQESGDLPPGQSLELLRMLVGGLGALHGRGIYFLGLNPHQVWMDRNGKAGLIRPGYSFLLEREDERLSREAAPYWAPEVLAGGEGTRASDIFSLGVMARRLLSSSRDNQELWRALREASTFDPARRPSSAHIFLERVEVLMSAPAGGGLEPRASMGKAGQPVRIPVNQPANQPVNQPTQPSKQPPRQPVAGSAPPPSLMTFRARAPTISLPRSAWRDWSVHGRLSASNRRPGAGTDRSAGSSWFSLERRRYWQPSSSSSSRATPLKRRGRRRGRDRPSRLVKIVRSSNWSCPTCGEWTRSRPGACCRRWAWRWR